MATTPTTVPAIIIAGDTVTWQQSFTDYPATTWTLKYALLNASAKISLTATASGTDYLVSATAATTTNWSAGAYDYIAWVEKGSGPTAERVTLDQGRITIRANLAAAATYDGRSDARKIYEALIAAYKTAATDRAFVAEYEINGRRMKFSSRSEWLTEINYWKAQVAAEDRAARLADGFAGGGRVLVRF